MYGDRGMMKGLFVCGGVGRFARYRISSSTHPPTGLIYIIVKCVIEGNNIRTSAIHFGLRRPERSTCIASSALRWAGSEMTYVYCETRALNCVVVREVGGGGKLAVGVAEGHFTRISPRGSVYLSVCPSLCPCLSARLCSADTSK